MPRNNNTDDTGLYLQSISTDNGDEEITRFTTAHMMGKMTSGYKFFF